MKTLLIMRHAKSSWKDSDLKDSERPLNKRGKKDAPFMAEVLVEKELVPQRILSSTAVRAVETVKFLTEAMDYDQEILFLDAYYMAEPETYIEYIRQLPDNIERVMVMGHNPGLEGLVQILCGQVESLPTAAVAHLAIPVDSWQDLTLDTECHLVDLFLPQELREKEERIKDDKKKEEKRKESKKDKKPKSEKHGKEDKHK